MSERGYVGLVGLGLMGTAMSTRLLAAGYGVVGFDVSADAREAHRSRGGEVAGSTAEVAARCRVLLLSLPNGAVSRGACLDPGGVRDGAGADTIVLETSTTLPEEAEALAADLKGGGVTVMDAALSGSSDMVARGETLGMVGGDAAALGVVEPVLRAFCREVRHVGVTGDGMRAKLVVNYVLSINRFALAEGLVFAERLQLDAEQALGVLRASAAFSQAMNMWGDRMLERRYSRPVSRIRQHDKDAQLMLTLGRRHGAPMFAMTQLNSLVQIALANGWGDADNAVLIEVLRRLAALGDPDDAAPTA